MSKKSCSGCLLVFLLFLCGPLPIALVASPVAAWLLAVELDSWYMPPPDQMERGFLIYGGGPYTSPWNHG